VQTKAKSKKVQTVKLTLVLQVQIFMMHPICEISVQKSTD